MRPCENPSPEDEEMTRKCEKETAEARNHILDKIDEGERSAETISHLKERCATIKSELYEFEPYNAYAKYCIMQAIQDIHCMWCLHRISDGRGCAQGWCDTLDRLEGRLWKVEG